jgi:hypothetical protein
MKPFFAVKFALLPFAVFFTLVARELPGAGLVAGFIVAGAVCAWRLYTREIKTLEIVVLAIFALLTAAYGFRADFTAAYAIPLSFFALSLFAIATVVLRRPWTVEFSSAAYPEAVGSPLFMPVNMALSAFWAALFILLALAYLWNLGHIVTTGIVVAGALVTIIGPRLVVRLLAPREIHRDAPEP